ncbi:amino acid ABC transporter permease [Amylibacter marinus]|uniref:Amino acid ABC transporter permease n=1 Tax=Amylibacter marinus TaxID=1475483 RepID=A0ABQ5VVL0_9RHOB|nr:ABC transporter permease subunit [Amylibacter marinus]GLQ35128.1 amino acid ABC transporter permease [Amylibacter marinus]
MSALPDPHNQGFRLSQLIYDTRYRSMTIQIVAMFGILSFIGWLIGNTNANLAALGKPIEFGFLGDQAGYDINQRLLDYDSQDSHLRAAFLGLLNTLLLALLGCITATILGVIIGVLRLSKNWIVARLMTVYIEAFRNIPVLLWILIVFGIMIEVMPAPRDFRSGEASMMLFDTMAVTNRGIYIPEPLFSGGFSDFSLFGDSALRFDVSTNLLIFLAVLFGGIYGARKLKKRADTIQNETGVRPTTWWQQLLVIFLPTILVLWAMGFHLGYPALKGFNFAGGTYLRNSLIALWIALSLYTAAFIAESVRAGIQAISKGQSEAAHALGISPGRTMNLVILPQALRIIIPPMISQWLNLTKNTSLAIAVGYMDLTGTLMGITLNQTGREMETLLIGMAIYLGLSLLISAAMNWYNNSVKLVER